METRGFYIVQEQNTPTREERGNRKLCTIRRHGSETRKKSIFKRNTEVKDSKERNK